MNEAYDLIIPQFAYELFPAGTNREIHFASDENYWSATNANARKAIGVNGTLAANDVRYVGFKYQGANYGDNVYFDIARCNNGIKYIPEELFHTTAREDFWGSIMHCVQWPIWILRKFMEECHLCWNRKIPTI
ncbi:hypothetical protein LWM68_24450 [Niabella sp. W65]|nr:hypothetical protein [Niabella sp. W65]MCH7365648.1 hypothetical protein [Niabella sp. W65]ULT41422.1 hypothetical protein KRR40_43345 [Niabella sp. I65]